MKTSKKNSFEGFEWKKFLIGFRKPFIMLLTVGIGTLTVYPEVSSIIVALGGTGVLVERIWSIVEFYIKEVKL